MDWRGFHFYPCCLNRLSRNSFVTLRHPDIALTVIDREVVGVGVLIEQVDVGEEAGAEVGEKSIAQEGDPGEEEADVAESGNVANPRVPEEG
jgi:hypothetical protein